MQSNQFTQIQVPTIHRDVNQNSERTEKNIIFMSFHRDVNQNSERTEKNIIFMSVCVCVFLQTQTTQTLIVSFLLCENFGFFSSLTHTW